MSSAPKELHEAEQSEAAVAVLALHGAEGSAG